MLLIFTALGHAHAQSTPQLITETGTLIIVGFAADSIVLAADSAVIDPQTQLLRSEKVNKIVPIGNAGACFIGGTSSMTIRTKEAVIDTIHFIGIVKNWSKAHPHESMWNAYRLIGAQLFESMQAFQNKHPFVSTIDRDGSLTSFACVGYDIGVAEMSVTDYFAATDHKITKREVNGLKLGQAFFVPFGMDSVSLEIVKNDLSKHFEQLKEVSAVIKYRKAIATKIPFLITLDDMLKLSHICMKATESAEGREFDPKAVGVAPPNHYAEISGKSGFKWVQ
jgi:hypothetical protein